MLIHKSHNFIGELQELLVLDGFKAPTYNVVREGGAEHSPVFISTINFDKLEDSLFNFTYPEGTGSNKKIAEQDSAKKFLIRYLEWRDANRSKINTSNKHFHQLAKIRGMLSDESKPIVPDAPPAYEADEEDAPRKLEKDSEIKDTLEKLISEAADINSSKIISAMESELMRRRDEFEALIRNETITLYIKKYIKEAQLTLISNKNSEGYFLMKRNFPEIDNTEVFSNLRVESTIFCGNRGQKTMVLTPNYLILMRGIGQTNTFQLTFVCVLCDIIGFTEDLQWDASINVLYKTIVDDFVYNIKFPSKLSALVSKVLLKNHLDQYKYRRFH